MVSEEDLSELEKELQGLSEKDQKEKVSEFLKTLPKEELAKMQMQQCPFCLIASGKLPTKKVYEDNNFIATLEINPANPGHVILFPKKHYQYLSLLSDKEVSEMFIIANNIAKVLLQELKAKGINLYLASGEAAGQRVNHISLNIIPRFENDEIRFVWNTKKVSETDLEKIASLIKSKINVKKEETKVEIKKERIPYKKLEKITVDSKKRMP